MTSGELVERALRRLGPSVPVDGAVAARSTLSVLIQDALRVLPLKVRDRLGETEAESYRTTFDITLTNGAGSYSTKVDLADAPLVPSDIVKVTHPDAVTDSNRDGRLKQVGSASLLDLERSTEYAYFVVEDNQIYTMMGNDRAALTGTLTIWAGFVPSLITVKRQHEPLLVECLAELAQPMIQKAA